MEYSKSQNAGRAVKLQHKRDKAHQEFEAKKRQIELDKTLAATTMSKDKFVSQNDTIDSELKERTFGLVQLEDFREIRAEIEEKRKLQAEHAQLEALQKQRQADEAAAQVKRRKKKNKIEAKKLSFDVEDEEVEDKDKTDKGLEDESAARTEIDERNSVDPSDSRVAKKMKKDPTIDTSFLPDREREEILARERMHLKKEWLEMQDKMKDQPIYITYIYWEAPGKRRVEACKQGDSIGDFLAGIRRHFPLIKNTSPEHLMYVKEGIIIPLHYTFYDFVINKTKGKNGLLFDPEAPPTVDSSTPDNQVGKVVDKLWYEKNKHIYPASQWELFDPQKDYDCVKASGKDRLFDFF